MTTKHLTSGGSRISQGMPIPKGHAPTYYYRPQRSWGKVMFSQACVILFTGGGVCLSACWDTTPPGADTPQSKPPGADTPQSRHTPPGADTPPPGAEHAGRYGQRAGGTHLTGMQSCFAKFLLKTACK